MTLLHGVPRLRTSTKHVSTCQPLIIVPTLNPPPSSDTPDNKPNLILLTCHKQGAAIFYTLPLPQNLTFLILRI